MKYSIIVAILAAALCVAAEKSKDPPPPSSQPVNKMCAVETDHEIDPKVTVEYKGKTIGFCCEDCPTEFKKDPEKYVKNLK
jgi:YHS domain-containing protein